MPELKSSHDPRIVLPPPRLHWGWVLALSVLTRSYFNSIWMIVLANWVRKVTGRKDALIWTIVNVAVIPAVFLIAVMVGATIGLMSRGQGIGDTRVLYYSLIAFGMIAVLGSYTTAAFKLRSALEEATVGLAFGGVMTFLFSGTYFQYFLHDYVVPDAEELYGALPTPPAYVPPPTV
ncbi:hypothetical protein [Terriglobus roseus]|uniref:Uncharacterized protein n=1 Tax=Terriglobus roseus TaxID=392734 RepID=A0A1G7IR16_9BACT|nr:hypothetical protein [Terriglobus roseus]SDF14749.1 hypothetical protein SAMN05444167_1531 [Terriglobus roseus]